MTWLILTAVLGLAGLLTLAGCLLLARANELPEPAPEPRHRFDA